MNEKKIETELVEKKSITDDELNQFFESDEYKNLMAQREANTPRRLGSVRPTRPTFKKSKARAKTKAQKQARKGK